METNMVIGKHYKLPTGKGICSSDPKDRIHIINVTVERIYESQIRRRFARFVRKIQSIWAKGWSEANLAELY
ncbi:MAG: hypothetical protein IPI14_05980 [Polaromonas sp.]|nr:hypothetical protein [Polaromonas sp.]